jgi:hypothetical protein
VEVQLGERRVAAAGCNRRVRHHVGNRRRLPRDDGQAVYPLKVGVLRGKRHLAWKSDGGDPKVVLRDHLTFRFQFDRSAGVDFSRYAVREKQRGDLQEVFYELPIPRPTR